MFCACLATTLRHAGSCWLKFDNFQTLANSTQHVTTCRARVAKRSQHVAPSNVAIVALTCCDRLAGALRWHVAIV